MPRNSDTPRCWNCSLDLGKVGLLRIGEAARKCNVSPGKVRGWLEEGDVEWLKLPNGFPMIVADSLGKRRPETGNRIPAEGRVRSGESPSAGHRSPDSGLRSHCFVCGAKAERSRILLDVDQASALCRVQKRTLARWVQQGWVKPEQGYFYLDSLFNEPRRYRDLDVRG